MNDGYTLSDIAAVNGNGNGFGNGNGAWWIVLFLIFAAFGGWGNGFGGFGGGAGAQQNYVLASDFATIQRQLSDGFGGVEKGIDTIRNGLCDGFYTEAQLINGVNTNIMQSANALQAQVAQCCCDIKAGIADVNYNIATQACGLGRQIENGFAQTNYNLATQHCQTLQAIDKVGDRVIDYFVNDKMQSLRDENQALRLSASQAAQNAYLVNELKPPCPVPAFITCNPYAYNYANNGGCGCGYNVQ